MTEHKHYWIVTVDDGVECSTCYQTMPGDEAELRLNHPAGQCLRCEAPVDGPLCAVCERKLEDWVMGLSSSDIKATAQ